MSGQSRFPGVWPAPVALHHLRERASAHFHCCVRPRSIRHPTSCKSGKPLFVAVWSEDEIRSLEGETAGGPLRTPGESGIVGEFAHQTRTLAVFEVSGRFSGTRQHPMQQVVTKSHAQDWRNRQKPASFETLVSHPDRAPRRRAPRPRPRTRSRLRRGPPPAR